MALQVIVDENNIAWISSSEGVYGFTIETGILKWVWTLNHQMMILGFH